MNPLTPEQEKEFYALDAVCHICTKPLQPDDMRHRDHCHLTGEFRYLFVLVNIDYYWKYGEFRYFFVIVNINYY